MTTTAAAPSPHAGLRTAVGDALTLTGRCVRLTRRDADTMVMSIVLPLLMMALFVWVFGGAITTGTAYIDYVVPGIVLLCTGHFGAFRLKTPFIEPQHTVDHFVQGLTYGIDTLGVLLPHEKQIDDFHGIPGVATKFGYASPYTPAGEMQLAAAGEALADTGAIVMHCMGYSEAMRRQVMERSRRPVLLSRRIVAHAIDLVLS